MPPTEEQLRAQLAEAEQKLAKAEARFKALLDKAGVYCGIRHSAGGAHDDTVRAYLELRDFVISARAAIKREQDR